MKKLKDKISELPSVDKSKLQGAKIIYCVFDRDFAKAEQFFEKNYDKYDWDCVVNYGDVFLELPEHNKEFVKVNPREHQLVDIYRHLDRWKKSLVMRTTKNLDTYYSNNERIGEHCWFATDNSSKTVLYSCAESDLLNSFRALSRVQKVEFLDALHSQVLINPAKPQSEEYSNEEKKLIQNYRKLNSSGQKLVKQTIETLNSTAAGGEQLKTNFNS